MKFLSIDCETTGLDPATDKMLEFAAVELDTNDPPGHGSTFRALIVPYAEDTYPPICLHVLAMHARTGLWTSLYAGMESISKRPHGTIITIKKDCRERSVICHADQLLNAFTCWLKDADINHNGKLNVGGKNTAFDIAFLKALDPQWDRMIRHRTIDPGVLWLNKYDTAVPCTAECMKRAGMTPNVEHSAMDDAMVVGSLIMSGLMRIKP